MFRESSLNRDVPRRKPYESRIFIWDHRIGGNILRLPKLKRIFRMVLRVDVKYGRDETECNPVAKKSAVIFHSISKILSLPKSPLLEKSFDWIAHFFPLSDI